MKIQLNQFPTIHHISSLTKIITPPKQRLNPHPTSNHINFHQNEDGWLNFIFPHIYFHFVSQFHNFSISQFLNFTIRWPPTRLSARFSLVISHVRVAIHPAQLSRSHTYLNSRVILSSSTFTSKTNHQQNTSQFSSQFTTYFITNIITNHSQNFSTQSTTYFKNNSQFLQHFNQFITTNLTKSA